MGVSNECNVFGSIFSVAGVTAEIQELVTRAIRSPPINSGIKQLF